MTPLAVAIKNLDRVTDLDADDEEDDEDEDDDDEVAEWMIQIKPTDL